MSESESGDGDGGTCVDVTTAGGDQGEDGGTTIGGGGYSRDNTTVCGGGVAPNFDHDYLTLKSSSMAALIGIKLVQHRE